MLVNIVTGEIVVESGAILSAGTVRSAFLSSPEGATSNILVKNEPWCSYKFSDPMESLVVGVLFKGDNLQSIHLAVVDSASEPTWSHESELARKAENNKWLQSKGLVAGKSYSWGSVWSDYDPRGGSSSAIISYSSGS